MHGVEDLFMQELALHTASLAAKSAGEILRKNFYRGSHAVSYKDAYNIVSESDKVAEGEILRVLEAEFPDHTIFSEERGLTDKKSLYHWFVDPLDGTTNFVQGFAHFNVSIGLFFDKKPLVGVVYDPISDELFSGVAGAGAFCNGRPIRVSERGTLKQVVILLNRGGSKEEKLRSGKIFGELTRYVRSVRILGAAAMDLCYVAIGKFDALVANGCEPHDCAAGNLIAQEAGARVSDFSGKPVGMVRSDLLVANPRLHPALIEILQKYAGVPLKKSIDTGCATSPGR